MKMFKFKCDSCGLKIETTEDQVGTEASCPGCHKPLEIPQSPAMRAAEIPPPPRTIALSKVSDKRRDKEPEEPVPEPDSHSYQVIPLILASDEEEDDTPISVAKKVERILNAYGTGGWRFLQIETVSYETQGAFGSREETVHLAIFGQD